MVNRGKDFEKIIKQSFQNVLDVSIDRLHDQTNGYLGSFNICDFIVYKEPYEYYIECKSIHGNTLPFSNITDTQWNGLLEKSKIKGVFAGVICWWIDKDVTLFLPIEELELEKQHGWKSVRYDVAKSNGIIEIKGKKKKIFFEYDMEEFFNCMQGGVFRTYDAEWIVVPGYGGWEIGYFKCSKCGSKSVDTMFTCDKCGSIMKPFNYHNVGMESK